MAKKTYRTFTLKGLQLLMNDEDGKRVEVIFRGGIQIDSTARFTTSNDKVQRMLEASSGFGRDYYVESVRDEAAPKPENATVEKRPEEATRQGEKAIMQDVKGSERFRNLVEMKNRMSELGITLEENANYATAKAVAAKAGYDFQIKKK